MYALILGGFKAFMETDAGCDPAPRGLGTFMRTPKFQQLYKHQWLSDNCFLDVFVDASNFEKVLWKNSISVWSPSNLYINLVRDHDLFIKERFLSATIKLFIKRGSQYLNSLLQMSARRSYTVTYLSRLDLCELREDSTVDLWDSPVTLGWRARTYFPLRF